MKIFIPYGIERIEIHKRRGSKIWAWIKANKLFIIAQTICLALTPLVIWLSEIDRGYRAYGSEMLITIAPLIYKFIKWIITYDD